MHKYIPLISAPIMPLFGLLWRMIENKKKATYYKNWRSVNEKAIYALVATAIKRANYNLSLAKVPSPADLKELYIDTNDYITIHRISESVLRSLKTVAMENGGKIENLEQTLRKLVLSSMNSMISTYVRTGKMFNQRDFRRNLKYAEEQIERAHELGFDDVAKDMEYQLKLILKDQ